MSDNDKPFVISWYAGVTRIDTMPRVVGNQIQFGCSIDGVKFEPFMTLIFEDDRDHAMAKRLAGAR